jgi:hypothetical protein
MIREHDDCKPYDARRCENRGIHAFNHMLYAFDNRLDIFYACPDSKIASFDFAKQAFDSLRQFDAELRSVQC